MFGQWLRFVSSWLYMVLLLLCYQHQSIAQTWSNIPLQDTVQQKLERFRQSHPSGKLFVHFDKTVYTNNENVWFTAYLLSSVKPDQHHTLSVCLVNDVDHAIALQERFIMSNGLAFGNVVLSDSIPPGNYTFMAYTNWQVSGEPDALFIQPVTIKTTIASTFKAMLSLQDTAQSSFGDTRRVQLMANGNDYLPLANAEVSYKLTGNDTAVTEVKARTDKAGQLMIPVPPNKNMIKATVKMKKNSQYLYLALPQKARVARVRFYPEGGQIVDKQVCKIGWEATADNNTPLKVTGILLDNNKAYDTLSTDSYGMGSFRFFPQLGHKYSMKLTGVTQRDTIYELPNMYQQGMSLTLDKALANDTLAMHIRSSKAGTVYLHVHNYDHEFFCVPVKLDAYIARKVNIALYDLPKGIAEVTLTDSMARPYAERLFFAHYDDQVRLNLRSDKKRYATRQKIDLELSLKGDTGDHAYVSVACVQDNRLEVKKKNDIESYFYLKSEIGDMPLKESYLGKTVADRQYLENVLLIRGWRRYTWPDLMKIRTTDTASRPTSLNFDGRLTINGKPLKKPGTLIVFRDSSSTLLTTDDQGHFKLAPELLINTQDKKIKFMSTSDKTYQLTLNDPYLLLNKRLASRWRAQAFERSTSTIVTENFELKGMAKTIQLKAVEVSARKDNSLYASYGANECGDYVCMYGILNCRNHPGQGTSPVKGQTYQGRVYEGCIMLDKRREEANKTLSGIYIAKEFYGSDYSVASPAAPEYISTIYWKHLVRVNGDKPTCLSFYAGDVTGTFRFVVQGITNRGVVHTEQLINIDKATATSQ